LIPEEAVDLVERLLQFSPYDRIGAQDANEIKNHPFLRQTPAPKQGQVTVKKSFTT